MSIKEKIDGFGDDKKAQVVAQVRAKHLGRWCERMAEIGRPVSSPDEIDYTDQQIHIEWLLCDPYYLHCIKSKDPKLREKFFSQLNEAELACYSTPTSDGACYADLEREGMRTAVRRAVVKRRRCLII